MILTPHRKDYQGVASQGLLFATAYAYGDMPAHYPVPSLLGQVFYERDRIGIEEADDTDWTSIFWERK